jgi:hypothetical protein
MTDDSQQPSLDDTLVVVHALRRRLQEGPFTDDAALRAEIERLIVLAGQLTAGRTVPADALAVARSMLVLGHPSNAVDRVLSVLLVHGK